MSMSTWLVGFKPADENYKRMYAVLDVCRKAKIEPPESVQEFFGDDWESADEKGVSVRLGGCYSPASGVCEYRDDMRDGFEVDLRELDPSIKILRFYNSY